MFSKVKYNKIIIFDLLEYMVLEIIKGFEVLVFVIR